mmetsp:Transcript_25625/g.59521  ORF Transcript_25625/g.59521 Transcript_25625/m.59521 type:complete len:151 (-) Transcript_25625:736-1188(-)
MPIRYETNHIRLYLCVVVSWPSLHRSLLRFAWRGADRCSCFSTHIVGEVKIWARVRERFRCSILSIDKRGKKEIGDSHFDDERQMPWRDELMLTKARFHHTHDDSQAQKCMFLVGVLGICYPGVEKARNDDFHVLDTLSLFIFLVVVNVP